MKKLIVLFLIFLSCSGNIATEEMVDESTTASVFQPATTIYKFKIISEYGYTLQEENYSKDTSYYCLYETAYYRNPPDFRAIKCFMDLEEAKEVLERWEVRIGLNEYREGWISQLLSYPLLTEEEYKISINLLESIEPGSTINLKIKGKDYSCVDKDSGMVINRFANEVHPIDLYEEGKKEALISLGYAVSLDYHCKGLTDGSGFPLYGPLFFQDNQWWGFQESDNDYWRNYEKDIGILAFMTKFAERISLAGSLVDN